MKHRLVQIVCITLIILIIIIAIFCFNNNNIKEQKNKDNKIIQIIDFYVEDRSILKIGKEILVGNNIKELENDFYDIKIVNLDNYVEIYLNKLWYETFGKDYIQDEYLAKICREIARKINYKDSVEEVDYILYKYIKNNYIKAKNQEVTEELITQTIKCNFELDENIVKLIIRSK